MKIVKTIFWLVICQLMYCGSAVAQYNNVLTNTPSQLHASPDMASLGKFGTYSTTLQHGLVDISIPIYTVKCGDIAVPINLSYHASGIKLNDIASNVGLGWTMNTGGAINIKIQGRADRYWLPNTQYTPSRTIDSITGATGSEVRKQQYLAQYTPSDGNPLYSTSDGISDIYSYSYPGGSGQFAYDPIEKKYYGIDNPSLLIKSTTLGGPDFILTDEKGNRYFYGAGDEIAVGTSGDSHWNPSLKKIVSANNVDSVMFNYSPGEEIREVEYSRSLSRTFSNPPGGTPVYSDGRTNMIYRTTILSSIITRDIKVEFTVLNDRKDRRKQRYSQIKVTDLNTGTIIKEYELKHSYFVGDNFALNPNNARLKLDTVLLKSRADKRDQKYIMIYNPLQLPNYFS